MDKYRPTSLSKLDYHKDLAAHLKKLVCFVYVRNNSGCSLDVQKYFIPRSLTQNILSNVYNAKKRLISSAWIHPRLVLSGFATRKPNPTACRVKVWRPANFEEHNFL